MTDLDLMRYIAKLEARLASVVASTHAVVEQARQESQRDIERLRRENRALKAEAYGMAVAMRVVDENRALEAS